jgi:hypothetical protein
MGDNRRDIYSFPYWEKAWARPFESVVSADLKYAWINRITAAQCRKLLSFDYQHRHEREALTERLFSAIPQQHRAPSSWFWRASKFSIAVCPHCLNEGYWSELPQLLGCECCPIHGVPLIRRCKRCLSLLRFGAPVFGRTGPFVCEQCGETMSDWPVNLVNSWTQRPNASAMERLGRLNLAAHEIEARCDGHWSFPGYDGTHDIRTIFHELSGKRLRLEIDDQGLFDDSSFEPVVPVTYMLPYEQSIFDKEVEASRQAIISDLARRCRQDRKINSAAHAYIEIRSLRLPIISYAAGEDLAKTVVEVFEKINESNQFESLRNSRFFNESFEHDKWADQAGKVIACYSIWQICRVLLHIESVIVRLKGLLGDCDEIPDDVHSFLYSQPYGLRLEWCRTGDNYFFFEISSSAFIAPYRYRYTEDRIELTMFQIMPQNFECTSQSRRYFDE